MSEYFQNMFYHQSSTFRIGYELLTILLRFFGDLLMTRTYCLPDHILMRKTTGIDLLLADTEYLNNRRQLVKLS